MAQRGERVDVQLLLEAGMVLATSLDVPTTIAQVAQLTVPRLADLCVIDLRREDGSIEKGAAAATDARVARELEALRARHPLDAAGSHPVASVIANGTPQLLPEMTHDLLESIAQGSEHARFMIEHDYRSAIVAPLTARGRTLGALSLLRLGDCVPYGEAELELGCELARRAALALDNARLFSDLRTIEQRLEAILANLAEAITVEDTSGRTVFANEAAAELIGTDTPAELTGAPPGSIAERFLITDEDGRELSLDDLPGRRLLRGEQPGPLLIRNVVRATGEERWLVIRSSPVVDPDTGRPRFAVNIFENITGVKRAQIAEGFMAEASRMLASSLDLGETLQRIARLAVPEIADWCAVDLVNERGQLERVAVQHADPRNVALAQELARSYRPSLDEPGGVPDVIRSGEARIYSDLSAAKLADYASDDEQLRLLVEIGANAVIIVPLAAPAGAVGAITLVSSESSRRLTHEDLGLAVRLGRRAGTAVESARLYTERTRIAKILEAALLPESLPQIPGAELQALYRAAGELNDVGGDFYDVFPYGDGEWMLVIGDVCGKGPRAAGVTALARHTLRAAALLGQSPAAMLQTLHASLRSQPGDTELCTVGLVRVSLADTGGSVTIALAGHPPPLLVSAEGEPRLVGEPGTLLGMIDPIEVSEVRTQLARGDTLLLYTDGLPDAGRSGMQLGESGLMSLCARAPRRTLQTLLHEIATAAIADASGRLRDDIAMLALRIANPRTGRTRQRDAGAGQRRAAVQAGARDL